MAQHLTQHDVASIAKYARIAMTEDEISNITQDLNSILDSFDVIENYDLDGVEPTFHPIGDLSNVMRDDVQAKEFSQETCLQNAPNKNDGCFLIPSILGDGGDR